ncbi:MAG: helix-turn-helix transcriptional regulator, partial [Selenomonas sp.]|nr:helix-turn-helix transcriptional regulator [Selenomonas sp.]
GKAYSQTRLRARRDNCGLSQSELAKEADVPLRQIQLFEQGQRDINKTSAITLYKLSKALYCQMEDLLEPSLKNDEENFQKAEAMIQLMCELNAGLRSADE